MIDAAWRDVIKGAKLISLPDVYLRLKSILDDPDFAMAEVAVVISQDPAITLRLLSLVNSSFYGFAAKIETVGRAIMLLGTQQVHDLVLATSVGKAFDGISNSVMDMQRYWNRSVHCAVTSRQLASIFSGCDKERLFVAGILHDIGHLIMYLTIPELSQQTILKAQESDEPLYEIERGIIGFDYAAAGAELMRQWSLPESLREITMFHLEPEKAQNYPLETALVHLGSLLARANDGEGVFGEGPLTADPSVWAVTGLSPEDCTSIHDQIEEETAEVMKLICPR
jgi:HD-like signal output (HDOD) protein